MEVAWVCVWNWVVYQACRHTWCQHQETGAKPNFSFQVTRLSTQPSFKLLLICPPPPPPPHLHATLYDSEGNQDAPEAIWQASHDSLPPSLPDAQIIPTTTTSGDSTPWRTTRNVEKWGFTLWPVHISHMQTCLNQTTKINFEEWASIFVFQSSRQFF